MSRIKTTSKDEIIEKVFFHIKKEQDMDLSMRKIADISNIAIGTLYLHFEHKDDVMTELAKMFWKECFKTIEFDMKTDFFAQIKSIYFHMLEYLKQFSTGILKQLSNMRQKSKDSGRRVMETYLNHMSNMLKQYIEMHRNVYNNDIDYDYFSRFLIDNFMIMLMRYDMNYDSFDLVIKKILLK